MNHAADPEALGGLGIFEKTCVYCGAGFRVLATLAPEANQPQSYGCPGCGKEYEIHAVAPPQLRLLRARTDGRDDRYQETMF